MHVRIQKRSWEHGRKHSKDWFEEKCEEMHLEKKMDESFWGTILEMHS